MTEYTTYGTSTHSPSELAQLVTCRLGLVFTERDSYFRGVYYTADHSDGRVQIQPNSIPGDDDEDELYASEHPRSRVLLLTTSLAPALHTGLDSIDGLVRL
ncbi:hypothetical protein ACQEVY_14005 [Streptomyces sp. CA-288835]|uniref:hypothetical protein n=1 Tax=Streptomyces sp. CA-288835 TaxID=3240069 RepID=UPI003D8F866C